MKKMNYLIVMPCFVKNSANETIFPLGIAYLSSSMKQAGFNVFTLNLNHCGEDISQVLRQSICDNSIDVLLTGGLSFQYSIIRELVDISKHIKNDIRIIIGGGIISGDPVPAMTALEHADFGVIGEGEITVRKLCTELEYGRDGTLVKGIAYKDMEGRFVRNPDRPDIDDLDSLPMPDYEGFEFEKHLPKKSGKGSSDTRKQLNSVYIVGSRSCPFSCTFCFHTSGKKYRQRSLDNIFAELDYLVTSYGITYIGIQDELFSHNKPRIMEFCKRIKKYGIGWWAQLRVEAVDRELLEMLRDAGCQIIGFGLESADNRILRSMRKGTTIEKIESTLKVVYEMGFPFVGTFIFGDPEETVETAYRTLDWWKKHLEYRIDLRPIIIYPGSPLYHHALQAGKIKDPVKFLQDGCPQINVSKLSDEEFAVLLKDIMSAPIDNAIEFKEYTYVNHILTAKCAHCGFENRYDEVVFFVGAYLYCGKCGQKYNITLIDEILCAINENIEKLLNRYGKIAIWAINYYINDLFNRSGIFGNENVFPIDVSTVKQSMLIRGKKIHHPDILNDQDIPVVVVGIPSYKLQIETQIKDNYKNVTRIIDICDLINGTYEV